MGILIIYLAVFMMAIIAFFSWVGLATILTLVFALSFPIGATIALINVIHFVSNLFNIALIGKNANQTMILWFCIPAIPIAFAGAWVLMRFARLSNIVVCGFWGRDFVVTLVKLMIARLLIVFSKNEVLTSIQKVQLAYGVLFGGFFERFSGIQRTILSAFLLKSGLSKEACVAIGGVIACMVDFTRRTVYASRFASENLWSISRRYLQPLSQLIIGISLSEKLLKIDCF